MMNYVGHNGNIFEKGEMKAAGPLITNGDIVSIVVDLINFKIKWEINGIQAA